MKHPFRNELLTDFSLPENVALFRRALEEVSSRLGATYPLVIDGERILTDRLLVSTNPANPSQVIGRVSVSDASLAKRAVASATAAF